MKTVKYQKPEVSVPAKAVRAIESHVQWVGLPETPTNPIRTTPAYKADE